jgi:uncharacterized protein (DUF1015 family)
MPEFLSLIGTRYNTERVRLKDVVAPPYDVISPAEQEELYTKDAHNVVRLILNHDADPYKSAKEFLDRWLSEGVLVREKEPAFYVYYQRFRTPDGQEVTRTGVLGRLKLSPYSAGEVRPHERTLAGPKKDRMHLMEAVHGNMSPIFGLIDDPIMLFDHMIEVATVHPAIADIEERLATGESIRHLLWKLSDAETVSRLETLLKDQTLTIADGHHRYETSLAFHKAHPEISGSGYVLTYLTNIHGEGSVILPTHRALYDVVGFDQYALLDKLRAKFELVQYPTREEAYSALNSDPTAVTMIELDDEPRYTVVRSRDNAERSALDRLPVMRLQQEILKPIVGLTQEQIDQKTNILYPHTLTELDTMREKQPIQAAFLLRAVTPLEMVEVVKEGAFMPQKSTFFFPKLLSGLALHEFAVQPT